jgi:hypothetical protein
MKKFNPDSPGRRTMIAGMSALAWGVIIVGALIPLAIAAIVH